MVTLAQVVEVFHLYAQVLADRLGGLACAHQRTGIDPVKFIAGRQPYPQELRLVVSQISEWAIFAGGAVDIPFCLPVAGQHQVHHHCVRR